MIAAVPLVVIPVPCTDRQFLAALAKVPPGVRVDVVKRSAADGGEELVVTRKYTQWADIP